MKELQLHIPEEKFQFVIELLNQHNIDYSHINKLDYPPVQNWKKNMVEERIASAKASDYIPWEDALLRIQKDEI